MTSYDLTCDLAGDHRVRMVPELRKCTCDVSHPVTAGVPSTTPGSSVLVLREREARALAIRRSAPTPCCAVVASRIDGAPRPSIAHPAVHPRRRLLHAHGQGRRAGPEQAVGKRRGGVEL